MSSAYIKVMEPYRFGELEWLVRVDSVSRLCLDTRFAVFDGGAGMNLTERSAEELAVALEEVS